MGFILWWYGYWIGVVLRVLNAYAGIGGNRKLWENVKVTAVEWNPKIAAIYKDFFPDDNVLVEDAHQYILEHYNEFDFIWSSPPCPTHSIIRKTLAISARPWAVKPVYPDMRLWQEIIFLDNHHEGKWCVENVMSYYRPLITPQKIGRHYYWANFLIRENRIPRRTNFIQNGTVNDLEKLHGFDLSKYSTINKLMVLRNCVEPVQGQIILDSARGNTQQTLI